MTLNEFKRLSKEQVRQVVRDYASLFAIKVYQKEHPGCPDDEAFAFAERSWQNFRERAFDLLAIEAAIDEDRILSN